MADALLTEGNNRVQLESGAFILVLESNTLPPDPPVMIAPAPRSLALVTINPTVLLGSMSVAPTNASAIFDTVDPTVLTQGGISREPTPVECVLATIDPTVVMSSVVVDPEASASFALEAEGEVILDTFLPSVEIHPAEAEVELSTAIGQIQKTIGTLFTPEGALIAIIWDPEEPL